MPISRARVLEVHRARRPLAAEHVTNQIAGHAQGQLGVLPPAEDGAVADLIVEAIALPIIDQTDQAVALVQWEGAGKVDQRLLDRCRAQADITQQPQRLWLELLAIVQTEVVAARLPRRFFQHLAVVRQREAQRRVLQQLRIDARHTEHPLGVAALPLDEAAQAAGGGGQHAGMFLPAGDKRQAGRRIRLLE
ncbi:hypothetical protein D3C77_552760 [compost metagenome]